MAGRKTILAVDDMAENLTTIRSILEEYFDVRLAKSAKAALSLMGTVPISLILLDIEMPGMSGFQFLDNVRVAHPDDDPIPVIFVTSHADSAMINKAINAGAKDYVVKPIKADTLLKKIDAVIGLPEKKGVQNPLEFKLKSLISVLASGDSAKAEITAGELERLAAGQPFYIREKVENIHNLIKHFDYEIANKKVQEFLLYLSIR
jgi:putative two-component system response regulator